MPWWLAGLVGLVGGGGIMGGVAAIIGSRLSAKVGIQGNEVQARADESTSEHRLIGLLETRLAAETARADRAEAGRQSEREYNEVLRRHIWGGGGWPPPARNHDEENVT